MRNFKMVVSTKDLVYEHFLYPATIFAAHRPTRVQTILGSCVAVCLFDTVLHHGAINHYMLPYWNGEGAPSPRYGNIAISQTIEKMLAMGSVRANIVAKVFGGADQHSHKDGYQIGLRNITIAQSTLGAENILTIAQSTGGCVGRKIVFHTRNNTVLVKYLQTGLAT
jgi:chemotaxis protein CheD